MAAPVNHLGEAKSFDGSVDPNLERRHLEVRQRFSRLRRWPRNPPSAFRGLAPAPVPPTSVRGFLDPHSQVQSDWR